MAYPTIVSTNKEAQAENQRRLEALPGGAWRPCPSLSPLAMKQTLRAMCHPCFPSYPIYPWRVVTSRNAGVFFNICSSRDLDRDV